MSRWAALVGLCVLTFLLGLNRQALPDADEGFYAEAGREMVDGGDWITPHFNGDVRLEKPVLYYWVVAASYLTLGGPSPGAARLGSALAGVGLALVAAAIARRWYGPDAGWLTGCIAATSLGVTFLARNALPDTPLALATTVAIWAVFEGTDAARPARARRRWWVLAGMATGAGLLLKGPVAPALTIMVTVPVLAWKWGTTRRQPPATRPSRLDWPGVVLASVVALILAVPWYAAATRANGVEFLRQFFIGENINRFATTQNNDPRSPWFYVPIVLGGLLPWSVFLPLLARPLRAAAVARRLSPSAGRLLAWAVIPLLFFTASVGKQPRYVLPCLVPMAVALGVELNRRLSDRAWPMRLCGAAAAVVLGVVGAMLFRAATVLVPFNGVGTYRGASILMAAAMVLLIGALLFSPRAIVAAVVGAAAFAGIAVNDAVFWLDRPEAVETVAAKLQAVAADLPSVPVCACRVFERNLAFYTHLPVVRNHEYPEVRGYLESPGAGYAAVDGEMLAQIERDSQHRYQHLLTVPYLNATAIRPGQIALDPNSAAEHVTTVVVVRK